MTDVVVSWSKYFNVTHPDLLILNPLFIRYTHIPTLFIHKTDSIMLWCDKVVRECYASSSFYEIGLGVINKQVETGQPFTPLGEDEHKSCVSNFVYVPSLVLVPE